MLGYVQPHLTAILWYLDYQRVHCHITRIFRKIWIMYDHVTFSVGAQPSWVCSKSQQLGEAFDGEWETGMKGSIFDQAEL